MTQESENIYWCWYDPRDEFKHLSYGESLLELLAISKSRLKKNISAKKFHFQLTHSRHGLLQSESIDIVNWNKVNPLYRGPQVEVLVDNEFVLVLNKPVKTHCHPFFYHETNNLISFALSHDPSLDQINFNSMEKGLLSRLDFETSGIVIILKKDSLYFHLRENFNQLTKVKIYKALITQKLEAPVKLQHFHYQRPGDEKVKISSHFFQNALPVTIEVTPMDKKIGEYHEVEIKLYEGKRHQIRAQMAYMNMSLVGDSLYGTVSADRLYLHAYEYAIEGIGSFIAKHYW
jgi:23S rRNA pseudouridine1911/1915/1917 synthase